MNNNLHLSNTAWICCICPVPNELTRQRILFPCNFGLAHSGLLSPVSIGGLRTSDTFVAKCHLIECMVFLHTIRILPSSRQWVEIKMNETPLNCMLTYTFSLIPFNNLIFYQRWNSRHFLFGMFLMRILCKSQSTCTHVHMNSFRLAKGFMHRTFLIFNLKGFFTSVFEIPEGSFSKIC